MNSAVRLPLNPNPVQARRLVALQHAFAAVCNALAPMVQQTRCWNRVALHHMAYKQLRQQFPDLGSQMVCNAIYSVSRACRVVYQQRSSPFNVARLGDKPLPRLHFSPQAPVYFDRHTLSIKDGQVSMYTLDGRMKFQLGLSPQDEQRFRSEKLREIVLSARVQPGVAAASDAAAALAGATATTELAPNGDDANADSPRFTLSFLFAGPEADDEGTEARDAGELPEYVLVTHDNLPAAAPAPQAETQLPT